MLRGDKAQRQRSLPLVGRFGEGGRCKEDGVAYAYPRHPRPDPHGGGERTRSDSAALLDIDDLKVAFHGDAGRTTRAVDGVSLSLARGRTLGVVGESGSGKSVTFLAVMGLLPKRTAEVSGRIRFDGIDLLTLPDARLRGDRLAMIFQEPMTSLNPSYTIGEQIIKVFVRHRGLTRRAARRQAIAMLAKVRIPPPAERIDDFPTSSLAACASAP